MERLTGAITLTVLLWLLATVSSPRSSVAPQVTTTPTWMQTAIASIQKLLPNQFSH
jgi:hypothetical protein